MAAPFIGEDTTIVEGTSAGVQRERGVFETIGNTVSLSAKDSSLASIMRMQELGAMNDEGESLEPYELRQRFPEHKELFTYPLTEPAAEKLISEKTKRQELQAEIDAGPKGAVYTAVNFVAGMIPHAIDPIDLAAGFGVAKVLRGSFVGAKLLKNLSKTRATRFAGSVGEAAVGNILVEPITMTQANLEGRKYGVTEAFVNSVGGAFMGVTLMKAGGKVISRGYDHIKSTKTGGIVIDGISKKVNKVLRKGPGSSEMVFNMVMAQIEAGRMVDVAPIYRDMALEISPVRKGATLNKIDIDNIGPGQKMYAAVHSKSDEGGLIIGEDFGDDLIYMSPDRASANGVAASKYNEFTGFVRELDVNAPMRLLDLNRPMSPDVREVVGRYSLVPIDDPNLTLREALDQVEEVSLLREELAENDYDGFYHDNRGEDASANIIALFNESKLVESARVKGNLDEVRSASKDELLEINRAETARNDTPLRSTVDDLDPDSKALLEKEISQDPRSEIDIEAVLRDADDMVKSKDLDAELVKVFRETIKETDNAKDRLQGLATCLGLGVV